MGGIRSMLGFKKSKRSPQEEEPTPQPAPQAIGKPPPQQYPPPPPPGPYVDHNPYYYQQNPYYNNNSYGYGSQQTSYDYGVYPAQQPQPPPQHMGAPPPEYIQGPPWQQMPPGYNYPYPRYDDYYQRRPHRPRYGGVFHDDYPDSCVVM